MCLKRRDMLRIAYYVPNVQAIDHQIRFCQHTPYEWLFNKCDKDVDLIYVASISVLNQAMPAAKLLGVPIICWVWDIPYTWREWVLNDTIGYQMNQFRDQQIAENIRLLKQCDAVLSASKYTQNVLKQIYNVDSTQLYWYYDQLSLDQIPEQVKEDQLIQISRYYFNKRFEVSILAAANTDYKMVCVGFGKDYCRNRLMVLPNDNVEYYCDIPREDAIRHLKSSKLLVSPSIFEGWGITPIEALHCNVPILLSDLPVFKEVYGDRVIYHERDNIPDMIDKIKQIMESTDLQRSIVEQGKDRIREFTPKKFAKRFMDFLKVNSYAD